MKLSPDKRNKLIAASVGIAMALGGLWFGVVHLPAKKLKATRAGFEGNQDKNRMMRQVVSSAPQLEAELAAAHEKLAVIEQDMPAGDLYSWFITTIKNFKANYRVDIPSYGNVSAMETTTLIPNFPYKQVRMQLSGSAFYQDFGRFLADFENRYSFMRVENISLDSSVTGQSDADREKLAFRMEIVALVSIPAEAENK